MEWSQPNNMDSHKMSSILSPSLSQVVATWKHWHPPDPPITIGTDLFTRICVFVTAAAGDESRLRKVCTLLENCESKVLFFTDEELETISRPNVAVKTLVVNGIFTMIDILLNRHSQVSLDNPRNNIVGLCGRLALMVSRLSIQPDSLISHWIQLLLLRNHDTSEKDSAVAFESLKFLFHQGDVCGISGVVSALISCLSDLELAKSMRSDVAIRLCKSIAECSSLGVHETTEMLSSILNQVKLTTLSILSVDKGVAPSEPHVLSICNAIMRSIVLSLCRLKPIDSTFDLFTTSMEWFEFVFLSLSTQDQLLFFREISSVSMSNIHAEYARFLERSLDNCFDLIVSQQYIALRLASFSLHQHSQISGFEQVLLTLRPVDFELNVGSKNVLVWNIAALGKHMTEATDGSFVADWSLVLEMIRLRAKWFHSNGPQLLLKYYFLNAFSLSLQCETEEEDYDGLGSTTSNAKVIDDIGIHWLWPCSLDHFMCIDSMSLLGDFDYWSLLKLCWERLFFLQFFAQHLSKNSGLGCFVFAEVSKVLCQFYTCRLLLRELSLSLQSIRINKAKSQSNIVEELNSVEIAQAQSVYIQSMVTEFICSQEWQPYFSSALASIGLFETSSDNNVANNVPDILHYTATSAIVLSYLRSWLLHTCYCSKEILPMVRILKALMNYIRSIRYDQTRRFSSSTFLKELKPLLGILTDGKVAEIHPVLKQHDIGDKCLLVENKVILGNTAKVGTFKVIVAMGMLGISKLMTSKDNQTAKEAIEVAFSQTDAVGKMRNIVLVLQDALLLQQDFIVVFSGIHVLERLCNSEDCVQQQVSNSRFYWKLLHTVFPEFLDLPFQSKISAKSKQNNGFDIEMDPDHILIMEHILQHNNFENLDPILNDWQGSGVDIAAVKVSADLLKNFLSCNYDFDCKTGFLTDVGKDKFIMHQLLQLWWRSAQPVHRIQGIVAVANDLFTNLLWDSSVTNSPKKAKKSQEQRSNVLNKSQFPHAGPHCTGMLLTSVMSLLPCSIACSPIIVTSHSEDCTNSDDGSPYHIFRLVCKLIIWIYHSLSRILCDQLDVDGEIVATHSQLLIKVGKGILEALIAKLISFVQWRSATTASLRGDDDDDNIDFGSLQFLHEAIHWAFAVMESLKRFQGLYLDVFTISDTAKSRWMTLEDLISNSAFDLENICAIQSLEADILHASELNRSCWCNELSDELKSFMLSNVEDESKPVRRSSIIAEGHGDGY